MHNVVLILGMFRCLEKHALEMNFLISSHNQYLQGPPLGDFWEEIGKVKIHIMGISTFRTTKHCAFSVEVDFTEVSIDMTSQKETLPSPSNSCVHMEFAAIRSIARTGCSTYKLGVWTERIFNSTKYALTFTFFLLHIPFRYDSFSVEFVYENPSNWTQLSIYMFFLQLIEF